MKELHLTEEDKKTLLGSERLIDKHIDGCGLLINKQFPELPRVQTTLYTQKVSKITPAEDLSLFFHYYSAHWVLSHLSEGHVHIYDSLLIKTVHPILKQQLQALYGEHDVELVPVLKQSGTSDCGCFVVAFAVSLLYGDNPAMLVYRQKEMRRHMADCLQKQHLIPFPASKRRAKKLQPPLKLTIK